jgi:hypothetical protein
MKIVICSMFLLLACQPQSAAVPSSTAPATADLPYIERFLQAWLLSDEPLKAEQFLSSSFKLRNDTASWPAAPPAATGRQRALLFARTCGGAPPNCDTLASCIRPLDRSRTPSSLYEIEALTVTDEMIAANDHLRERRGQTVVHLSFMLNGCNLGTSILIEPTDASDALILSIFYLAG